MALYLNNLNSSYKKKPFEPRLVEIGPVVLEKIFKSQQYFCPLSLLSSPPHCKTAWPNLNSQIQKHVCAKLVEIGLVVLEKKTKMWKVYNDNDDRQISEKLTWAFGSGELKMVRLSKKINCQGINPRRMTKMWLNIIKKFCISLSYLFMVEIYKRCKSSCIWYPGCASHIIHKLSLMLVLKYCQMKAYNYFFNAANFRW